MLSFHVINKSSVLILAHLGTSKIQSELINTFGEWLDKSHLFKL